MKRIEVKPYDPKWRTSYLELESVLRQALKDFDVAFEHVGSTSVVGLWAKPILDIDIIYRRSDEKDEILSALSRLGYIHQGNKGIEARESFDRLSDQVPFHESRIWMAHHLYLIDPNCIALSNHLLLRDYLRSHPEAAIAYSRLKREIAERHPHDIESYIDGKTEMITGFLKNCGMDEKAIEKIESANKK